jgi:hypothetical protein
MLYGYNKCTITMFGIIAKKHIIMKTIMHRELRLLASIYNTIIQGYGTKLKSTYYEILYNCEKLFRAT